jgi:peptidoglycan hydrolase-like protein with peptidoglycan-binding domain
MKTTAPPPVRETVAAPAPPAPAPALIERLQRSAGNQAVTAYLRRQEVETKPHLSAGQAAHAVAFYTARPELYPADVILKIQKAVGSPQTGVADAEMAEAVARWQYPQSLKPDGMAGPRTLPRMFESGLAEKKSREAVVKTAEAVQHDWKDLKTAEARAAKLYEGVKAQLEAAGVKPPPKHKVKDLGKSAGLYVPKDWTIYFDDDAFSAADLDDDAAREVAGTVYHEARHAEQGYKMARMLAAKNNTPEQISAKMDLPLDVATEAHKSPLPKGVEFATASQQFDSVYGAGKAQHKKAEAEAVSGAELRAAKQAADDNPTPANKARYQKLLAAHRAYHDLPTENDAFGTEFAFEESWDEAHP